MAVHMEYEEILEHVGSLGKYQIVLFNLIASLSWKSAANMVITVFHVVRPSFVCQQSFPDWLESPLTSAQIVNLSASIDQCTVANSSGQPCRQFAYDRSQWLETIATEYDLVCDRKALEPLVFASYALGYGFGFVLGILADKYGRRPVMLWCCAMETLFTLLEIMSTNFLSYLLLHFAHGIFATVGLLSTVCITEFVGCKHRAMVANLLWLYWCIGYMSVAGLAYFVRQWHWLQLLTCLPCLFYIACYFLLQESPRWLIANGRYTEALRVCENIARVNGRTIPRAATELLTSQAPPVSTPEGDPKEMFKTRIMLKKTIILFCAWFAISLNYNSISLDSGFLANDVFVNTVLSGVIEVPAYITAWIVAEKIGRRIPIAVLYVTLSACLIAVAVLTPGTVAHTTLALLAKLSATCAFSIIINYSAEVYPTTIRNTGIFCCSAIGRVSAVIAPFIVMSSSSLSRIAAPIAFACLGILAGAALYYLPETKGIPLPQTVQEANIITPGKEVAFISLVQKRREEIAVYFVGRGESATVSFTNPAVQLELAPQNHAPNGVTPAGTSDSTTDDAAASVTPSTSVNSSQPAGTDDDQVSVPSKKYLIDPYE